MDYSSLIKNLGYRPPLRARRRHPPHPRDDAVGDAITTSGAEPPRRLPPVPRGISRPRGVEHEELFDADLNLVGRNENQVGDISGSSARRYYD